MKYIKQLSIILAVTFAGEVLNHVIPLPVPAGIYGIVILFLLLLTKVVPLSLVEDAGGFLIDIMALMFIPAAVGLIESWNGIRSSVVAYVVICLVSTVVTMVVSGHTTQLIMRIKKKGGAKNEGNI